ncbi:MBL fold metallo-hydrolase [Microbacteriaceae bacterium VKM Ac-2855]|nr:MBL fold metallo-hydrolase [Microbacteriaceae bacterium VKM Ac-2855]
MLTQVVEGVQTHRSELLRNNAVIVDGVGGVLLVDPGLTTVEMRELATVLRESSRTVAVGFATHPHWDHVLWDLELGDVPRDGTGRCAAEMRELLAGTAWRSQVADAMPPEIADAVPLDLFGLITPLPTGVTMLPWEGTGVRIIEHRAHSVGHAALLLEERRVLIAGDMLSDLFPPMLDFAAADPIGDYLSALDLFEERADHVDVVIPGHGSAGTDLRARVEQDRSYVLALRDGRDPIDPRIQSPEPGWEWVAGIHDGQREHIGGRR